MTRAAVPVFDLLPAVTGLRRRPRRTALRPTLLAVGTAMAAGLLIMAEGQRRLQDERDALVPMQAELERLQARQSELTPQVQAQQNQHAQRQAYLEQRARWQLASQVLQRLGQAPGRSARLQLLELRLDEQGLLLTGQMLPTELQPWMAGLKLPLGPGRLLELSAPALVGDTSDGRSELSRFVIRHPPVAGSIVVKR